ncbi:4-alpha-glucanotransferase [Streptomyces sp. Je 1-369]|uniref:4-alpha-glucanotransferase n=1 Tax=Streptomyces sp. Je 1-369 TaxID=2966192 RepID=UPI00228687FA|nr:4-alpha-glucanotransferase [Streptomyces sp. Je 1-369]WAL95545.1 4-alpha-glucanotransferase [Streptomyces sp. Je 1-369]
MPLSRLAASYGVATSYSPSPGRTVPATDTAVIAALAALGVDASTPQAVRAALTAREAERAARPLPPTVVAWTDGPLPPSLTALPPGTRVRVEVEEGGGAVEWETPTDTLPEALPTGVHRLHVRSQDPGPGTAPGPGTGTETGTDTDGSGEAGRLSSAGETAYLIVAPRRVKTPARRTHGLLVQLYSLLSRRSWGMGDLGDLAELSAWAGRTLGTGFVQVNPLHAAVPSPPQGPGGDPSPYRPSSRRFPDPVHLRVEAVPEYAYLTGDARERVDELGRKAALLRDSVLHQNALIDRDAVWALKREALELLLHEVPLGPGRRAAYNAFLAEQGTALEDHATWNTLAETHGPDWHSWPAVLRDPASPGTARARREAMDRVDFHCRLAWLTDTQLAAAQRTAREAGMDTGLVHDLAVGVHPGGADAWAQQRHFAPRMSVGAPPDAFNARGQDWGLPPWRPDRLAESGYAPYRALLRGLLRNAGALRIDHVMGLFRLWWIPEGREPTEGTYVHYDAEAMLAVLVLEARRADALVIGEDLGTVEPGVRETLREHGVLGTSVLWFERDWEGTGRPLPADAWRADCVATATTHDLPPTAARLTGEHVQLRHDLGLLTRPLAQERAEAAADVREWLGALSRLGMLSGGIGCEEDEIRAVHRFLLATPARMIGIWLPDAVGDRRPQNLPGTWDQYPNWRLPVADAAGRPVTLEDLAASPRLHALMAVFRDGECARTAPPGAHPV